MTGNRSWLAWLSVLFVASVSVGACGGDDAGGTPDPPIDRVDMDVTDSWWVTVTDPETGLTYRCLNTWMYRGLGLWCDRMEP